MEEDQNAQEAETTGLRPGQKHSFEIDPLLVDLLNLMEAFGFAQDLTVMVQGFLVSGTPIFLADYLERQGDIAERAVREFASRKSDPDKTELYSRFGEVLRSWYDQDAVRYKIPEANEDDPESKARREAAQSEILETPREAIMLKRVSIITPEGEQVNVPLWRGRLSHIAGWWQGRTEKYAYEGDDPQEEKTE